MRRKLFTVVSLLSLLLCVATVVLWVRSYWIVDIWVLFSGGKRPSPQGNLVHVWEIAITRGACTILHLIAVDGRAIAVHHFSGRATDAVNTLERGRGARVVSLLMPTLVFSILPALWLWLRSPRRLGHCDNCGYDLTGNTSGVCPECGTASTTPENAPQKIPVPHGEK
jgi:hypothetical protein